MNRLQSAFGKLQTRFASTLGGPQRVKIGGKPYDAIIEEATFDDIELAGGNADAGGVRVMITVADCAKRPKQGDPIEVRGETRDMLTVTETNSTTWTIVAGEMAAE